MAPSRHEDEGDQHQPMDTDKVEEEEECSNSVEKLISQGINAGDVKKLQSAGIHNCNTLMKHTKKSLTRIKGLSKAKVDKIYEATGKILNQGLMTGNDLLKVPCTREQRTETIISSTKPKASVRIKNYTVLNLDGNDELIRDRWMKSIRDLRSWCFNTTNNRYIFGKETHKCAMIPEEGHFFVYLHCEDKWLCLVIEGCTLYLVGFITSSMGPDVRVQEMDNNDAIRFIEGSVKMNWNGNYKDAEKAKVGAKPLKSAFYAMYKHTAREWPRPSDDEIRKWCDILIIHFPEAGRFDSLLLCNVNRRFSEGGKVGKQPVRKATNWSKKCHSSLKQMDRIESEMTEGNSKKGKLKTTKTAKRKAVKSDASGITTKRCKVISDEQIQSHVEDCRLLHRSKPRHLIATLSSMPIQLCNGKAIDYCAEDSETDEDEEMNFLIQAVNGISHDTCGYVDGEWTCVSYLSESGQPATEAKISNSQLTMELKTSDSICLGDSEQPNVELKTSDSQPALELKKGHSAGLYNLGNTCYANSTLQCMYTIPELKSALQSYPGRADNVDQASHNLTLAIHETFIALDQSDSPVSPHRFLKALREKYPIFADQTDGLYKQQDAEECWTHLLQTLSETLVSGEPTYLPIKELFGIGLVSSENGMDIGTVYSLKCEVSQEVNHIEEGLKHGLNTHSTESKIDELPKYLTVQFCRVFWDRETEQTAKLLRKVDYPMELDIYELCSDNLKQKLEGLRQEPTSMDIDKGESSDMDDKRESSSMDIDNGIWVEFDDDKQRIHEDKDILKLSGGGEGHMAYICLFKARLPQ